MEKEKIAKEPCPYLKKRESNTDNNFYFYCVADGEVKDIMNHFADKACERREFFEKIEGYVEY